MKPYYEHAGIVVYHGDVLACLQEMPPESVHCVVTSPPYFGLRDYGTASWEGGDEQCEHNVRRDARIEGSTLGGGKKTTGHQREGFKDRCGHCGATRVDGQIGLESTPQEFVAKLTEVFREVRRVLRKDGTCWVNMGDSYAANRGYQVPDSKHVDVGNGKGMKAADVGLKPKDLMGIPWRLAFALQDDGWYLRQDIIWAKPNPMPESVTDRCTKAHEYIFLLSKSERYYYDADAIKEEGAGRKEPNGRNKRSVWQIATEAFAEAHFATFPTKLVEPCMLAGCPDGGTVLDPFGGSMTTLVVAQRLGHKAVAIELNAEYIDMGTNRLSQEVFTFPVHECREEVKA